MSRRVSTDLSEAFPVVATLAALDAWQRDPTESRVDDLRQALGAIARTVDARGAYLVVDAPLPPLRTGIGTLSHGPHAAGRSTEVFPLEGADGEVTLGSLWLEAETPAAEILARALGLALDAAWSSASARQTIARMASLDEATRGIAGVLSVDEVLQVIVDRVRDLVLARYAALGIVDESGRIERFITSGISDEERARIGPLPVGRGLLGLIIRKNRTYRIAEIGDHPDSSGFPANHPPMHSFLGVPVAVKGHPVGNLYLTDKGGGSAEFSEQDQRLVETFALHAGIAIENARLHEQVQRLAVVEERERIGKDLHDGIIQSIYAVALGLEDVPELIDEDREEAVGRIDRAIDALNVAIRDIRNFIFGLRPELLESADLVAGLSTLVDEFRVNTMIDVELSVYLGAADLPLDARAQVLHITREALSNAARHSGATHVDVSIDSEGGQLVLTVADNGRGFDPGSVGGAGHFGLPNIAARATAVGGELALESAPGSGTRIIVRIPIAASASKGSRDG
jgi:signal transduction histidine kinase